MKKSYLYIISFFLLFLSVCGFLIFKGAYDTKKSSALVEAKHAESLENMPTYEPVPTQQPIPVLQSNVPTSSTSESNYAKSTSIPQAEALALLSKMKDLVYRTETGLNISQFSTNQQDIYVGARRLIDSYPNDPLAKRLNYTSTIAGDVKSFWSFSISMRDSFYNPNEGVVKSLRDKYPNLDNKIKLGDKLWFKDDIISALFSVYSDDVKNLERQINSYY